jgi:hypothetical protein
MADRMPTVKSGSEGSHEQTDAHAPTLFTYGGALLLLVAGVLALMWGMLKVMEQHPPAETTKPSAMADRSALPPEPRLQTDPAADMQSFRIWEDSMLTTYGWVDRTRGIVRVPIESAMVMVVRRGVPLDKAAAERAAADAGKPGPPPGPDRSGPASGSVQLNEGQ